MEKKRKIIIVDDVTWQYQFQNGERLGNCNDKKDFHDAKLDNEYTILVEYNETTIKNWLETVSVSREILDNYTLLDRPDSEDIFNSGNFDMLSYVAPRWYGDDEDNFKMKTVYFINHSEIDNAFNTALSKVLNDE